MQQVLSVLKLGVGDCSGGYQYHRGGTSWAVVQGSYGFILFVKHNGSVCRGALDKALRKQQALEAAFEKHAQQAAAREARARDEVALAAAVSQAIHGPWRESDPIHPDRGAPAF